MFKQDVFRQSCAKSLGAIAVTTLLQLTLVSGAHAGTIVQCGAAFCATPFSITADGNEIGGGNLLYDANSGVISLDRSSLSSTGGRSGPTNVNGVITWTGPSGSTIGLRSITGNADPILGFDVSASTAGSGVTFGYKFELPIAISGQIRATSDVSYSLSSLTSAGAEIRAVTPSPSGGNKVVTATDSQSFVGGTTINKGVDAGDTFFFLGGPSAETSTTDYATENFFALGAGFDLMTVSVDFFLSANSLAGVTGFVQQVVVPLPAALPLLLSGLAGFGFLTRRRRKLALA